MSVEPLSIDNLTIPSENYEENEFLANIGLLSTTIMTRRQLKKAKKLVAEGENDELFIKLPAFGARSRISEKPAIQEKIKPKVSSKRRAAFSKGSKISADFSEDDEEKEKEQGDPYPTDSILGKRLYNFLKYLSSHRWIWCEFMDSFLDKPTLGMGYDMKRFIAEYCPLLESRCLPRRGWQLIRRSMGKSRRFSPAFIELERKELECKRRLVRQLQQNQFHSKENMPYIDQIPKQIPLPLVADAKVSGFLHGHSLKGIVNGSVMGYDPQYFTYVVRFARNGNAVVLSLPDSRLYSNQETATVPLSILMRDHKSTAIISETAAKREKFGNKRYNKELLESVLKVSNLKGVKQKIVMDLAQMNEDFETGKETGLSSCRRDAKITPQRENLQRRYAASMITLHRLNTDILEPLRILHDHLTEYRKLEEEQEAKRGRPASEVYQKCRKQAEQDLKAAGDEKFLKIESDQTREFVCNLHTILYLNGKLGRENSSDMETIIEDLIAHMVDNIQPSLGRQFKEALDDLMPLRQQVAKIFNDVQKTDRFNITQQSPMQTEDGIYNFVVEAQADSSC
ncbi:protein lin-9 [Drosophila santomea]|uniref:protein lin-9 n=1 Tax=Drosophila santomea TaxID=129105 RepID=UPI001953BCAA|nr:protein lin-9 [Drosophila santomea]